MLGSLFSALWAGAVALSSGACNKDEPKSAWPEETRVTDEQPTPTGEELVDLYGDRLPAGSVARLGSVRMLDRALGTAIFSSDGKEIITSSEEAYLIWQTTTAKRVGTLPMDDAAPTMALTANGATLATATFGGDIRIWDYPARKLGGRLSGHRSTVTGLCFIDDNTLVSSSDDRSVRVWTLKGAKSKVLRGDWEQVSALICTPSGVIIFGDTEGRVASAVVTEGAPSEPILLVYADQKQIAGAAINGLATKGKTIAAAINDGSVAIWTDTKKPPIRIDAHKRRALSVAFSGADLMTSGADPVFRLWDPETGEARSERKAAADVEAQLFRLSPDGNFVVAFSELRGGRASESGRFWLYDGPTGSQLLEPERHTDGITQVQFTPDDKHILTSSADGTLALWNRADGSRKKVLASHKSSVHSFVVAAKRKVVYSAGDDARMHVTRLGGGDSVILEPLGGAIHALALSPNESTLLTGDFVGSVASHAVSGRTRIASHDSGAFSTIHSIAYSPNGANFVVAGGNRHMHLVSSKTGKKVLLLSPPEEVVANRIVAFSPNGKLLASGGDDHRVRLWSTTSWKQAAVLEGHDGAIRALAFSRDGKRLATGSSDEVTRVWDIATRKQIALLAGHRGAITTLAFSADGRHLVTGAGDETALIWELAPAKAKAAAAGASKTGEAAASSEAAAVKEPSKATETKTAPAANNEAKETGDGAKEAEAGKAKPDTDGENADEAKAVEAKSADDDKGGW